MHKPHNPPPCIGGEHGGKIKAQMTILQGGKQETGRTAPASGKRRALLLVKGNRPTKLVKTVSALAFEPITMRTLRMRAAV